MDNRRVKSIQRIFPMILAIVVFLGFPSLKLPASTSYAAGQWLQLNRGLDNDEARKTGGMSASPYTNNLLYYQMGNLTDSIVCFKGPDNCSDDPTIVMELNNKGALGSINSAIGYLYTNPPADLAYWAKDTAISLGFMPKPAMAQGIGFNGLIPLLPIWKAFRNIAYTLLALSMVVIGFMVMMRKKIDPKTVVTVQNSLPRIVMALILITFSYAIVGLMIDIMYLAVAFITIIIKSGFTDSARIFPINYTSGGLIALMQAVFDPVTKLNPGAQVAADLWNGNGAGAALNFGKGLIFGLSTLALGGGPLFQFLIALAFLFAFIRILLLLLNSYTQILLAVLTGPLQILIDVFPGAEGFSSWIKNIVANLVVFPVTILMLMLGNVIGQNFGSGNLWIPPMLPQWGGLGGLAEVLISLGIILSIPNIASAIKESMKAKSPIDAGPGAIFGPLGRAAGTGMQGLVSVSMIAGGISGVTGIFGGGEKKHGK